MMTKPVFDRVEVVPRTKPEDEQKYNLYLKQVTIHLQTRTTEDIDAEIERLKVKIQDLEDLKQVCNEALIEILEALKQ